MGTLFSSLAWKYLERTGNYAIQFIVQIVLARLLLPSEFGLIAITLVFINVAQVFVQSGFNAALIQNQDVTEVDYSSVFYLNLLVASVLYVVLFFFAPVIAIFYKLPELVLVLRVLAIILFLGAVNSVQNAIIAREFKFKELFYSSFVAVVLSGSIGIYMAYNDYGVWALVWQQTLNQIFLCIIIWRIVRWRLRLIFSIERVFILFSFGWKLLVSGLLNTLYMEMVTLVVGKLFTPTALGYYTRGELFPKAIVSNIDGSMQAVMFTAYSREQDNSQRVKEMVRKTIMMSSFIITPLMAGMIAMAEPIVRLVLTDKWLPCVPFLQVSCLAYALMPIHTSNLQAINAMGRSDIFLRLEIMKKVCGLVFLSLALFCFRSVIAIAWSGVFGGIVSSFINALPNKKLLGYGYVEQIKDLLPSVLIASIMGMTVYLVGYLNLHLFVSLLLQIAVGIIIYPFLAWMFKIKSFVYLVSLLFARNRV